jgi:predicted DNA-binding transcriptional regulator AlpA
MSNSNLQHPVSGNQKPISEMNLIRITEVCALSTLKRSSIFKAIKNRSMPQPIKLLGRINAWDKNEILIWLESMRSNKK